MITTGALRKPLPSSTKTLPQTATEAAVGASGTSAQNPLFTPKGELLEFVPAIDYPIVPLTENVPPVEYCPPPISKCEIVPPTMTNGEQTEGLRRIKRRRSEIYRIARRGSQAKQNSF